MKIISTRSDLSVNSEEAILKGLSTDGGLFVFEQNRPIIFHNSLSSLSYQDLTLKIMTTLFEDYDEHVLKNIVYEAYGSKNFPDGVVKLESFDECAYLELYHGPTFSFKDLALSILPLLMKEAKRDNEIHKKTVILTATSGDTGSAALSGFGQDEDTVVFVLYPRDGISKFQELQMNGYQSSNLRIFGIDGNFDDCQNIVKKLFKDLKPRNITIGSANSINIGRLVPQIVYYFYSYFELRKTGKIQDKEYINVCVPTGNFGNIYAAYLAREFGLPIAKLIVASNKNNVLTDLFETGIYNSKREFSITHSPSMDILISSNVERYIFDLLNQDVDRVSHLMEQFTETGNIYIEEFNRQIDFTAGYASEEETLQEIKRVFETRNYLIDPHTAVASFVNQQYQKTTGDTKFTLIVSTASPFKFSESIQEALRINKGSNLLENIDTIGTFSHTKIDKRMIDILSNDNKRRVLAKETAYDELKRMIGEIDG